MSHQGCSTRVSRNGVVQGSVDGGLLLFQTLVASRNESDQSKGNVVHHGLDGSQETGDEDSDGVGELLCPLDPLGPGVFFKLLQQILHLCLATEATEAATSRYQARSSNKNFQQSLMHANKVDERDNNRVTVASWREDRGVPERITKLVTVCSCGIPSQMRKPYLPIAFMRGENNGTEMRNVLDVRDDSSKQSWHLT